MPTVFEPAADAGNMVAARTTFRRDAARAAVVSRPALWERLDQAARVTVVSAPPGSGKTVLLRSWISWAGVAERAAWVPAGRGEREPGHFVAVDRERREPTERSPSGHRPPPNAHQCSHDQRGGMASTTLGGGTGGTGAGGSSPL